ncbi:deleted in azoospermia-like isoform X2 [Dendronephthya gigantea]|nr:deleted in azoospermia-like isoform X2 [Dendronephthya gigantea]
MCETKLQLAFQDLNFDVQDTRIVLDMKTGEPKGYGFVTFYNVNDAKELIKKGFVVTNDGVKLKIDTAVRKKGMQHRLQNMFSQNVMINKPAGYDHCIFYPSTQNHHTQQAQIPDSYKAMGNYATNIPFHPSCTYFWQT